MSEIQHCSGYCIFELSAVLWRLAAIYLRPGKRQEVSVKRLEMRRQVEAHMHWLFRCCAADFDLSL